MNIDALLELHRAIYENNEITSDYTGNALLLPEMDPLPARKESGYEVHIEEPKTMQPPSPEPEALARFYKAGEIEYPSLSLEKELGEATLSHDRVLRWSSRSYSQEMEEGGVI